MCFPQEFGICFLDVPRVLVLFNFFYVFRVIRWLCTREDTFNPKTIITPTGVSFKFWRLQFPLHPTGYKDSPFRLRAFILSNGQLRAACSWNEMQYNSHIHVTKGHNNSIICGMLRGITTECNPTFDGRRQRIQYTSCIKGM